MALQLHPDKCRAPHATEAFKGIGYFSISLTSLLQHWEMLTLFLPMRKNADSMIFMELTPQPLTVINPVGDIEAANFSSTITHTALTVSSIKVHLYPRTFSRFYAGRNFQHVLRRRISVRAGSKKA